MKKRTLSLMLTAALAAAMLAGCGSSDPMANMSEEEKAAWEAAASDPQPPTYIFEGPGEILAIKGSHAQLRWRRPVPDVWLRLDQLEPYSAS